MAESLFISLGLQKREPSTTKYAPTSRAMLCENRSLPGSPSICTLDNALVPLPSFLLIVLGPFVLFRLSPSDRSRTAIPRWIHILYMTLVAAAIGMTIVELARDAIAHLGVGLIPVVLIGLTLVFVGLFCERKGRSQPLLVLFFLYWLLNIVFQSIKVARVHRLDQLDKGPKKYPNSDLLLDNAVILGLYIASIIFEAFGLVLSLRHRSTGVIAEAETKPTIV